MISLEREGLTSRTLKTAIYSLAIFALLYVIYLQDVKLLLVVLAAGALIFISKDINMLIYTCIFTMVLGQVAKLGIGGGDGSRGIPLLINDILVLYILALWLIRELLGRKPLYGSKAIKYVLPFLVCMIFSICIGSIKYNYSYKDIIVAVSYIFRWVGYSGLCLVIADSVRELKHVRKIVNLVLAAIVLLCCLGFLQVIIFPRMEDLVNRFPFIARFGYDPHEGRLVSTFLDPNLLGAFLNLSMGLIVGLYIYDKKRRNIYILSGFLVLAAIFFTFSRGTLLSLIMGILWLTVFKYPKLLIPLSGAMVASIPLFTRVWDRVFELFDSSAGYALNLGLFTIYLEPSAYARIISYQECIAVISKNLLFGVGYNAYGAAKSIELSSEVLAISSYYGADSTLLLILATTGIVGLSVYLYNIVSALYLASSSLRNSSDDIIKAVSLGMIFGYITLLSSSQTTNALLYPFILQLLNILLGLLIAGRRIETTKTEVAQ